MHVMPHIQMGGSTNISLTATRGKNSGHLESRIGWADPMQLEVLEEGQKCVMVGGVAYIDVHLVAKFSEEFEDKQIVRWSAAPRTSPNLFGETRLDADGRFTIRFPGGTEGLTSIRVVATPPAPGFLHPLPKGEAVFFDAVFHSRGPTLEDHISVLIKPCGPTNIQDALDKAKAESGDVQVSLFWSSKDDIDLHVVAPSGEEIYYGHRKSICGGHLDVDMNVGYGKAVIGAVENVFWPVGKAPRGKYRVYVVPYSHHGGQPGTADPARFSVRVIAQGRTETFNGVVHFGKDALRKKVHVNDFVLP